MVDNSGVETEEIDLIELITYNCSAIRITKRFLDYGLYKFKYTLTVYGKLILLWHVDTIFKPLLAN